MDQVQQKQSSSQEVVEKKDHLTSLMEENIRLSKEILENNIRIRKYMKVRTLISIIWLIIIVAPIIFAILWLPPFLKDFMKNYNDVLNGGQQTLDIFKL